LEISQLGVPQAHTSLGVANDTITVTGASTERISSDYVDRSVQVSQSGPSHQAT